MHSYSSSSPSLMTIPSRGSSCSSCSSPTPPHCAGRPTLSSTASTFTHPLPTKCVSPSIYTASSLTPHPSMHSLSSRTVSFLSLPFSTLMPPPFPLFSKISCSVWKYCYLECLACPKHLHYSPLFNLLSPFYSVRKCCYLEYLPPFFPPSSPSLHRYILLSYSGSCGQTCPAMATRPLSLSTSSDTSPSTHHSYWRRWAYSPFSSVSST